MLKKYKIVDDDSHKGAGAYIPGFGMVPLDKNVLTDEMAEAAVESKSPFFELSEQKLAKTANSGQGQNNQS